MPGIMEMLFGSKGKTKQIPTMDAGQQQVMQMLQQALAGGGIFGAGNAPYQAGMGYLQDLYSQSPQAFGRLQEPYMQQFQQQIVPGIAERFSQAGGRSSSAFNQAMGQAGAGLESGLASMFENLRSQNLGNLMGMTEMPYKQALGLLGQKPFGYTYEPGSEGFLSGMLGGLGGGIGLGGGLGLGSMLSNYLMGSGGGKSNPYLTAGGGLNF